MSEMILRYRGSDNKYVSDPPGLEMWWDGPTNRWVTNDGRDVVFNGEAWGWDVRPDGKFVQYNGAEVQYESDDGTIIVYFDGARWVWVIDESATSRFRVYSSITGNGMVSGAGLYEPGAPVTISATPTSGWELSSFMLGGSVVSNPYTFTMPSNNVTISAVFTAVARGMITESGDVITTETGLRLVL